MIAFILVGLLEIPASAGGAGLALFAATLGLSIAANSTYGWYDPYYASSYYPNSYYPPYYAAPIYETAAAPQPPPSPPVRPEDLRPSLPNMTPRPGDAVSPSAVPRYGLRKINEQLASARATVNKDRKS